MIKITESGSTEYGENIKPGIYVLSWEQNLEAYIGEPYDKNVKSLISDLDYETTYWEEWDSAIGPYETVEEAKSDALRWVMNPDTNVAVVIEVNSVEEYSNDPLQLYYAFFRVAEFTDEGWGDDITHLISLDVYNDNYTDEIIDGK